LTSGTISISSNTGLTLLWVSSQTCGTRELTSITASSRLGQHVVVETLITCSFTNTWTTSLTIFWTFYTCIYRQIKTITTLNTCWRFTFSANSATWNTLGTNKLISVISVNKKSVSRFALSTCSLTWTLITISRASSLDTFVGCWIEIGSKFTG